MDSIFHVPETLVLTTETYSIPLVAEKRLCETCEFQIMNNYFWYTSTEENTIANFHIHVFFHYNYAVRTSHV